MIHWLKSLFSSSSTESLSNNKNPRAVSFALAEEDRDRTSGSSRKTNRRDPTRRTTVPELPVTITNNNGNITIEPLERDLYAGEQVKWICPEAAWEVRFDQAGSETPFDMDVFGPGLIPPPLVPETNPDLLLDEVLGELSGVVRDDALEGAYNYSVQLGGFGPLTARIRIMGGPRPK